jgi:hypothetical protein
LAVLAEHPLLVLIVQLLAAQMDRPITFRAAAVLAELDQAET